MAEVVGVVGGKDAVGLRGVDDRDTGLFSERFQFVGGARGEQCAAADHDHGTLCGGEDLQDTVDGFRRRCGSGGRHGLGRERDLLLPRREHHVDGYFQVNRSRTTAQSGADGLVHEIGDPFHVGDPVGPLRRGLCHRDLIEATLQRVGLHLAQRREAGDEQGRDGVEMGVGHRGEGVGEPRARGDSAYAQLTGRPSVGGRGMAGGGFVPGVGQTDRHVFARDQERVQVASVQDERLGDSQRVQ